MNEVTNEPSAKLTKLEKGLLLRNNPQQKIKYRGKATTWIKSNNLFEIKILVKFKNRKIWKLISIEDIELC